jgi:hypothetical protein
MFRQEDVICLRCSGSRVRELNWESASGTCAICHGQQLQCVPFGTLATAVESAYRGFYQPTRAPVGEGGPDGQHPLDVMRDLLGDEDPGGLAEYLLEYLASEEQKGGVKDDPHEPVMFDVGNRYEFHPILYEVDYHTAAWQEFEEHVRYRARFFDAQVRAHLNEVFDLLARMRGELGTELAEGTVLYRARVIRAAQVEGVEANPVQELGPAPRACRRGGRLDAPGISTLYAAFSGETAVAELRPAVGAIVAYAAFPTVRPLRVLDLTAASSAVANLLHPEAEARFNAAQFALAFHDVIAEPVLSDSSQVGYVPTQIVAEYLANELKLDGLVYRSAQTSWRAPNIRGHHNVALFNAEHIVAEAGQVDANTHPAIWFMSLNSPTAIRYTDGSLKIVRIRSATFGWTPTLAWGDQLIDLDEEGLPV